MKKHRKRSLSLVLCLLLTICLTGQTIAYAEESTADLPTSSQTDPFVYESDDETEDVYGFIIGEEDTDTVTDEQSETDTAEDTELEIETETVTETQTSSVSAANSTITEETDPVTAFVTRLYTILLQRDPDSSGLANWSEQLSCGTLTGAEVIYGFTNSEEFLSYDYSDEEYVELLYQAVFDRNSDSDGFANWIGILEEGFSRNYVLYGFVLSTEYQNMCADYDVVAGSITLTTAVDQNPQVTRFVNRLYENILGRSADSEGREYWVSTLASGKNTAADVVIGFIYSTEFTQMDVSDTAYVEILYQTLLNRSSDADGLANWMYALNNGMSWRYVLKNFIASSEFKTLAASYGVTPGSVTVTEARDYSLNLTLFIRTAYQNGLGRTPSASEVNYWAVKLYNGSLSGREFVYSILFSEEGSARYSTDREYVILLYQTALQRTPSASEVNSRLNNLSSMTYEDLFNDVTISTEFQNVCSAAGVLYITNGWITLNGNKYYYKNGSKVTGWQRIDGNLYYFLPASSNAAATGWKYIDGYKYYFYSSGILCQDVDDIIGTQSSYYLTVNKTTNTVTVYARDGSNGYIIPVKCFVCSTGKASTPSPSGSYTLARAGRWYTLNGPVYGQYCTRITAGYLFHSSWYYVNGDHYSLSVKQYKKLGTNASHGCVRLTTADAKWIYDNCNGCTVYLFSSSSNQTKFDKPTAPDPVVVSGDYGYDPTDPYFD